MKKVVLLVVFSVLFIGWGATRWLCDIKFTQVCGGHLKRAADANTIELATQELDIAVRYLEENQLTQGYTSVIYRTPDEDIGFWYKNLRASLDDLRATSPSASSLEKSNVLIKLRETLLDNGDKGESITVPEGISVYPHNIFYFIWGWVSLIGSCVFGTALFSDPY